MQAAARVPKLQLGSQEVAPKQNLPQVTYGKRRFTFIQDIAPLRSKEVLSVLLDSLNFVSNEFRRLSNGPAHSLQELNALALKVVQIKATACSRREYIPYLAKPHKIARAFTCIQALDELLPRMEKKLRYTQVLALSPEYENAVRYYQQVQKACTLITRSEASLAIEELQRLFNELETFINPDAIAEVKQAEERLYEELLELLLTTGTALQERIKEPKLAFLMDRIRGAKNEDPSPEGSDRVPIPIEYKNAISKLHVYLDPPDSPSSQESVLRLYEMIKAAHALTPTHTLELVRAHALIDTIISQVGPRTLKFTPVEEELQRGLIDGTVTNVAEDQVQGYLKKGFLRHIAFSLKEKDPAFEQAYTKTKALLPQQLAPQDFFELQQLYNDTV